MKKFLKNNGLLVLLAFLASPVFADTVPPKMMDAKVQDGYGTKIDSLLISGKQYLDVNAAQFGSWIVSAIQSGTWSLQLKDGAGNNITSQANGGQRALDVGINVAGVQVDPRTRTWSLSSGSDIVNVNNISGTVSLPTGAATGTKQDTGNTSLSSIDGKLNSLGQKTMAGSVPVTMASDQSSMNVKAQDGAGNALTSQANGGQRALDVGIDVAGVQVDPRNQGTPNTASNAWPTKITDGTNTAAVKAAATAPTVADPALVVGISPNSPITVTSVPPVDANVTGTITSDCPTGSGCAASSYVMVTSNGYSTLGYETHGTWTATITTDVSYDPLCTVSPSTVLWFNTASFDTDGNKSIYVTSWGNGLNDDPWVMNIAGTQCARVRASSYTSGTVNVTTDTGVGVAAVWAVTTGNAASGSADAGNPVKVGGRYNLSLPTLADGNRGDLQLDSSSRLIIRPLVSGTDTVDVNNISGAISLPTGAATSANQSTEITSLQLLDDVPTAMNGAFSKGAPAMGQLDDTGTAAATEDNVAPIRITAQRAEHVNLRNNAGTEIGTSGDPVRVDPTGTTTQPISAASLPLPTGASTSANQTTANSSLSSIDGKLNSLGQKAMTGSVPVVVASDQSNLPVQAPTDATTSGSLGSLNATVTLSSMHGYSSVLFQLTGTWVGTVLAEASIDGTNWTTVSAAPIPGGTFVTTGATTNGLYRGASVGSYTSYRLRMSAYTSGTASVLINSSTAPSTVQAFQFNAANLNAQAAGDVAAAATDSGNPVKVGGRYTTSTPSLTSGQRGDAMLDKQSNFRVNTGGTSFLHVAGATAANTLKSGAGRLINVCYNQKGAGTDTVTLWDNTTNSGTVIAIGSPATAGAPMTCQRFDLDFATGLTVTTTGASADWTFVWQ